MAPEQWVDFEWLDRRQRFCRARIKARAAADKSGPEGLVVAGLYRELAAIELLLGHEGRARYALRRAGTLLTARGLAGGLVLLALAGADTSAEHPIARAVAEVARQQGREGRIVPDGQQARAGVELHSPHQWMATFQAIAIARARRDRKAEDSAFYILEERLRPQAAGVMSNGLPFATMLDLLTDRDDGPGVTEAVELTMAWRRQALRIARQDDYHWRMSLDPARLVDFDLIAVFSVLIERTDQTVLQRFSRESDDTALGALPLRLAENLRRFHSRRPRER